jgi:hypothetical protein
VKTIAKCALALLCAALFLAGSRAADEFKFKTPAASKEDQTKYANEVMSAVLKQMRPTGKNPTVESAEFKKDDPKAGRTTIVIKCTFTGAVVKSNKYEGTITLVLDSNNPKEWEALNLEYSDNDKLPITSKEKKLKDLVASFNK